MKRKSGRGALVIIALLFASSGALRLGDGLGTALAFASETADAPAESGHITEGETTVEGAAVEGATPAECPPPPAELARALSEREGRLAAAEASIADREAALALADEAIGKRLAELKTAEEELKATLTIADGAAEEDLARLTAVYETMKPKDAAALFEAMEADFAAGFLGRMRPDAAAAVMAGMAPDKAYAVSAILAGRNALVPKD